MDMVTKEMLEIGYNDFKEKCKRNGIEPKSYGEYLLSIICFYEKSAV